MNKDELVAFINNAIGNKGAGANLFAVLNRNSKAEIKRVDIDGNKAQNRLYELFSKHIKETIIDNEAIEIVDLSKDDDRVNALYRYDLEEFPYSLDYFKDFEYEDKFDKFSFDEDTIFDIEAFIIVIGNQKEHCVLYKKMYPIFLLKRDGFFLMQDKTRFVEFSKDLLRITPDYQLIKIKDEIFITNLKVLERYNDFKVIVEKRAQNTLEEIKKMEILDDVEGLEEFLKDDISFARKLGKAGKSSPVINLAIPKEQIIEFSKKQPGVAGKLKYTDSGDKIILTTKVSKNIFLKLLDDSFLVSELTKQYYASIAKDKV